MKAESRHIAPGQIYVKRLFVDTGDVKSKGGILMPTTPKDDYQNGSVEFGVVLGCGLYQTRQGEIHSLTNWPIKAGTLVEYKVNNPFRTKLFETIIGSMDVTAIYEDGKWPEIVKE